MSLTLLPLAAAPAHGADLTNALQQYGGEPEHWLDLSAAISPYSWWAERGLMPAANSLRNLPQPVAELAQACVQYYGHAALPVPGSQAAIQTLPRCFAHARVWVQADTYAEHAFSWQQAGHNVQELTLADIRAAFNKGTALPDMVILVNPANPSGECVAADEVQQWTAQLHRVGAYVLVDEAFMDCTPEHSILNIPLAANRMVLRSLGKFFGLAGLRCGFVFAAESVQHRLQQQLGPWAVNSLALSMAAQVLRDEAWQQQQRLRLLRMQEQVLDTCRLWQLPVLGSTPLFVTFQGEKTQVMHTQLAQQKIWSRYFPRQQWLRMGMPDPQQWPRLYSALKTLQES